MEVGHRRSIRLTGYDYSKAGAYFVTVCTAGHRCSLGRIYGSEFVPSQLGQIAAEEWLRSQELRPEIDLDEWVLMPNHLHGIVIINEPVGAEPSATCGEISPPAVVGAHGSAPSGLGSRPILSRPPRSLGSFLGQFKAATSRRAALAAGFATGSVWQRNFYEHVIRDEEGLDRFRRYIVENPSRWAEDHENPQRPTKRSA